MICAREKCDNEASAYQDWDERGKRWVSVCLPHHIETCQCPSDHGVYSNERPSEPREPSLEVGGGTEYRKE